MEMALLSLLQHILQELHETPFNAFLSLLFLLSFLYVFKLTRVGKLNLPPSPPKLPIIGNIHQLGTLPHRSLGALAEKHGPLMLLHLGHAPTVVVSSADLVREMKTHDIIFSNRPQSTAANIIFYGYKDVLFTPYGEYWRQVRKISVLELLSLKRVQSFQNIREEEAEAMVDKIRNACLNGDSIDLSQMSIAISNNIICRCILGQKFEEEDGNSCMFGEVSRRATTLFAAFSFGDFFPFLWWIDVLTGLIPRLKATIGALDALFDQMIEEHKTRKSDQSDEKDFMDILLHLQKDGTLDIDLTQHNLKAILLDMFLGATDTTSTTLEWAMAELVKNPRMMKKAQEEVRGVVGKKSKIEVNDINQMEYLKCIVKETLRLHPPAPLLVPRETSASVKLGGYDIPAKTRVLVNVWAIQSDPKLWDRPEEFLPERFENNTVDFKGQDFQFIPFGSGRRGCPGITFGVTTIEYVIANLLYWFDWKLPGANVRGEDLDMTEIHGLIVCKKIPLHLLPILHSP